MGNLNADKLRELKKLLDEGVITEDEFDEKKKEFLEEISDSEDNMPNNSNSTSSTVNGDLSEEDSSSENQGIEGEDSDLQDDDLNEHSVNSNEYDKNGSSDGNISTDSDTDDDSEYSNSNTQKSGYKIGVVVVAIVAIVAIFGIFMNHKDKTEDTASTANTAQTQKKETSPEEWKSFDDKSWEDFKEINQNYNNLKDTVNDTSNPDRTNSINKAKQYFSNEANSLNYGQNEDQNKYLNDMKEICQKAETVCDDALKAKSSGNQSEFDVLKGKLDKIENQISSFTKTRPGILQKAGYTENQIKEIIDKIKADLGIN